MKRAQIFDISMIFVVIGAMVAVLLVVTTIATDISPWYSIGQRAFEIQDTYAEADYMTSFMASGARWASWKAISELGLTGGFYQYPCGTVDGITPFWNKRDEPRTLCFPNAYENFYALLGDEMDKYIELYGRPRSIRVGEYEVDVRGKPFTSPYEFLVQDNRLLGIATGPVFINILTPFQRLYEYAPLDLFGFWTITTTYHPVATGLYVFRPDIEVPFEYDLRIYKTLAAAAQDMVIECTDLVEPDATKACVQNKIQEAIAGEKNAQADVVSRDDNYVFTITQEDQKTVYLDDKPPVIKFALALPPTD